MPPSFFTVCCRALFRVQFSFNAPKAVTHGTILSLYIAAPADLDGDGHVGTGDLLILLSEWGACRSCPSCRADLDGDCMVGAADILSLLDAWV